MAQRNLTMLRASVENGAVRVRAYKSQSGVNNAPESYRAIRVFRREAPKPTVGREYFEAASWRDAELIHNGPIAPHNDRKFTYIDDQVSVNSTYAYWMASAEGEPTGPEVVRIRDLEVWWPYDRIAEETAAIARDYPGDAEASVIGRTIRGRDILGLRVGAPRPAVGLVGLVHAGESGPELILPVIRRLLAERSDLLGRVGIAAIPVVNADERERMVLGCPSYLRTNANDVDLNRNFPANWDEVAYGYGFDSSDPDASTYRGPRPASEPETQAVMYFFEEHPVDAAYAFHCLASICGCRFITRDRGEADRDYASRSRRLGMAYARAMLPEADPPEDKTVSLNALPGTVPRWFSEKGVPAFDIEISPELESRALEILRATLTDTALLDEYRQRHFDGLVAVLEALQ